MTLIRHPKSSQKTHATSEFSEDRSVALRRQSRLSRGENQALEANLRGLQRPE
jgi:hypothetical protein